MSVKIPVVLNVNGQYERLQSGDTIDLSSGFSGILPVGNGGMDTSSYHILDKAGGGLVATNVAGNYVGYANMTSTLIGTAVTTWIGVQVIHIYSADYPTINTLTTKLRIRGYLAVNHTAPTGNFTLGLFPITQPASSGGAAVRNFTLGSVIAASVTNTLTTPLADTQQAMVGSDFALPTDGIYVIACTTTSTIATASQVFWNAYLQIRNA